MNQLEIQPAGETRTFVFGGMCSTGGAVRGICFNIKGQPGGVISNDDAKKLRDHIDRHLQSLENNEKAMTTHCLGSKCDEPKMGMDYWWVIADFTGVWAHPATWTGHYIDRGRLEHGTLFLSESKAQEAAEKIKSLLASLK